MDRVKAVELHIAVSRTCHCAIRTDFTQVVTWVKSWWHMGMGVHWSA